MVADSKCTTAALTKYMETQELPPPDTVCDADHPNPFLQPEAPAAEKRGLAPRGWRFGF